MSEHARGHHAVFLGMAAGVGNTYRALQELRAEYEAGRDAVIGYLEPSAYDDTRAQARGLPRLRPRRVPYKNMVLEELDLPALLARRPEVSLIDELSHSNTPGVEHRKRYEDVDDALAAGIDVYSTVNVQHVESLNDPAAELLGARLRETLPDRVLLAADDVVIVDLTPPALIARLRALRIYRPERV